MRERRPELPLWHAGDCVGETGAAAGICHCIAAATSWHKKYSPGPIAACFGSAVPGERAVAILRRLNAIERSPVNVEAQA